MARGSRPIPDKFRDLLDLVQQGKVFALQQWIGAGKPLKFAEVQDARLQLLHNAVRTGFHSVVEVLLTAITFDPSELSDALELAHSRSRYDIAQLLAEHGAHAKKLDFATACEKLDFGTAEQHLRSGLDPNKDNAFAVVLTRVKAKPLLGFYRRMRTEFPGLDDQAALALRIAVRKNDVRWASLLVWAGADPMRPAPDELDEFFPVDADECDWGTAALDAIWHRNPQLLKVLRLRPTGEQAIGLLYSAARNDNLSFFKSLLAAIPRDKINHTERDSCRALEELVDREPSTDLFRRIPNEKGNADNLQCIELLLDAGARWNPKPDHVGYARRALLKHDARYVVQVVRLLLYTPNAANVANILELCRSPKLMGNIVTMDAALVSEIDRLRKEHRVSTSNTHNTASTRTVTAAEQQPHC